MDLVHKTKRTIRQERLIRSGDIVICAVSGGPDSMALWHVLLQLSHELSFTVVAAHMNHQFRGEESDQEAVLIADYAAHHKVLVEQKAVDVPRYLQQHGGNAQAVARELRYQFLVDAANKHGANRIALAHHGDDQAETVLHHFLRGSGLSGLSGMPIRRNHKNMELIRPFLRIYKLDLLAYCHGQQIPYALDSSNGLRKYTRNRIRLDIMPVLLEVNAQLPHTINRFADMVRDEDDYLEQLTQAVAERLIQFSIGQCNVSRKGFIAEPIALQRRLIKLILNYLSESASPPDFTKVEIIRTAILNEEPPSLYVEVGNSIRVQRTYDNIVCSYKKDHQQQDEAYEYQIDSSVSVLAIPYISAVLRIQIESLEAAEQQEMTALGHIDGTEATFDADQIKFPLLIRTRRDGDRIEPIGLNGSKKVKDMFIDLKIPPEWRKRVPLVEDANGQLLWIAGIRRSRHALVTLETRRLLRLRLEVEDQD
jgi:tRNA(Ile)-lysidine synthase